MPKHATIPADWPRQNFQNIPEGTKLPLYFLSIGGWKAFFNYQTWKGLAFFAREWIPSNGKISSDKKTRCKQHAIAIMSWANGRHAAFTPYNELFIKPAETRKVKKSHRKDNGDTLLCCWISPYILDWRPAGPPNCWENWNLVINLGLVVVFLKASDRFTFAMPPFSTAVFILCSV